MLNIGTSGWSYKGWAQNFYPDGLPASKQLEYLAQQFSTVELNSSFYRLPSKSSFERWQRIAPRGFHFAVKVPRTITHFKRLHEITSIWQALEESADALGDKLAVYLLQFPSSFAADSGTLARLEALLALPMSKVPLAFEMRHGSWFQPACLEFFAKNQLCLVQADSSRFPHSPEGFSPSSIAYYRFHGPRDLYASDYTDAELTKWAALIRGDLAHGKDVFAYFDNDANGYAPRDARRLSALLGVADGAKLS
jgi:uncharacterized protein YecE (DUF72 family)